MKLFLGLLAVCILGSSGHAVACEKHNISSKEAKQVSESSIYNIESKWTSDENKTVQLKQFAGRPRLVAMIYTKCQTACPLIVQDIKGIVSKLPKELRSEVHVDLFSFEHMNENAQTLTTFRNKFKLDESWSAYKGSKSAVSEMAAILGVQYKALPSGEYIHSNQIFFLNNEGEVIAKHEGLNQDPKEFLKKIQDSRL